MGFMDKAKKFADQAQTKLDEVQKQFNEGQQSGSNPASSSGPAVEYDQHGRPIGTPYDESKNVSAPQGDPLASESAPPPPPADKTPHVAEPPGDSHTQGDPLADSSPKPSQPPAPPSPPSEPPSGGSGLSSGDPLAG